ncbi:MAG TPA: HEAT repeat domain-containing protein, partial [Steroidobacteraceae bacterium]
MSFITNLRADRLIAEIKATEDNGPAGNTRALEKLAKLGASAIPRVIDALANADKQETAGFVSVLSALLDQKTFALVASGLVDGNQRTVAAVTWALSTGRNYPANLLFSLLESPQMPKSQVVSIMAAQKSRLNARDVLQRAYSQEPAEKAAMFRIIGEIADETLVPELISRLEGKDPIARTHIINILSRFNRPDVAKALQGQLRDSNKFIRQAVLNALARMGGNVDVGLLCEVLRDPDVETQQKAIDAVVRANHPDTIRHLIAVLRDEDENARRAAVEVLNEI